MRACAEPRGRPPGRTRALPAARTVSSAARSASVAKPWAAWTRGRTSASVSGPSAGPSWTWKIAVDEAAGAVVEGALADASGWPECKTGNSDARATARLLALYWRPAAKEVAREGELVTMRGAPRVAGPRPWRFLSLQRRLRFDTKSSHDNGKGSQEGWQKKMSTHTVPIQWRPGGVLMVAAGGCCWWKRGCQEAARCQASLSVLQCAMLSKTDQAHSRFRKHPRNVQAGARGDDVCFLERTLMLKADDLAVAWKRAWHCQLLLAAGFEANGGVRYADASAYSVAGLPDFSSAVAPNNNFCSARVSFIGVGCAGRFVDKAVGQRRPVGPCGVDRDSASPSVARTADALTKHKDGVYK